MSENNLNHQFTVFFNEWIEKLGLSEKIQKFQLYIRPDKTKPVVLQFNDKKIIVDKYSQIFFKEKEAIIILREVEPNFMLIHELGHLYLVRIYQDGRLGLTPIEGVPEELIEYMDVLLDCFVNYNLCKIEGAYPLYVKDTYSFLPEDSRAGSIEYTNDSINYLKNYIYYSISIQYILKKEDRNIRLNRLKGYLRALRDKIRPRINFKKLFSQLKKFGGVKDTQDSQEIIDFIYDCILCLDMWSSQELKKWFNAIFS